MYICIYVHLYICICICTVFLYVHVHIRLKMTNLFTFPWNMRGCGGHLRLTFFLTLFLFERFRFKDFYGFRFMHFWVCKFPGFEVKLNFIFDTLGDSNSQSFGPQSSWNLGLAVHIFYNAYGLRFICSWTWRFIGLWGLYMFKHFLAFRLNFFGFKIELSRLQIPGWHFCLEPKGLSLVRAIRMKVWKFKYVYQILLTYWDHGGFSQPCSRNIGLAAKRRFVACAPVNFIVFPTNFLKTCDMLIQTNSVNNLIYTFFVFIIQPEHVKNQTSHVSGVHLQSQRLQAARKSPAKKLNWLKVDSKCVDEREPRNYWTWKPTSR